MPLFPLFIINCKEPSHNWTLFFRRNIKWCNLLQFFWKLFSNIVRRCWNK